VDTTNDVSEYLSSRRPNTVAFPMNIYSAEPGTRSEESLRILGSWSATPEANVGRGDQAGG
jgi:hypothetical protein